MQIVSYPKETICIKSQSLFSGKNIIILLSAELAQKMVKINVVWLNI